ncbi:2-haloalkanoic acid dehalogenase [Grosmannia clavigera kw1407]|uniref:2-haloalkanoic acid dehalogenase n=1 Tax=Grosmannia clavigera (strain kw1407 / UAMH 11150) TaxID=655863 RepID=F0XGF7_GROCL|nr:2-haloalkanoic acid dehalogenase [Grosmannia clavigera kw1407]EFX03095.1 2-haloalkanoic acid dehalogenase [Grosmannia clavigera kw1407]
MSKNVVFDVVGSLVSYDHLFDVIEQRFGADRLRAANINARLLGQCWIETAEREYTYLSLSGRYATFFRVFGSLFYRMLRYAGLKLRSGAAECIAKLRAAGFTVWCLTAGDLARVGGYFSLAGVDMPSDNLLSCDSTGVAKPDPGAYRPLLAQLSATGATPWFAAAHMWDVSTARTIGFRGAYCTVLEADPMHDIFGDMDVIAHTLPEMADMIIAATP